MNARRRRDGIRARITEFVAGVLPTIARPLTPDVTDHVFRAIEDRPVWLQRYGAFRDETPGGVHTVNAEIGRAVKRVLATDVIGRNESPESGLIDSCSRLAVRPGR